MQLNIFVAEVRGGSSSLLVSSGQAVRLVSVSYTVTLYISSFVVSSDKSAPPTHRRENLDTIKICGIVYVCACTARVHTMCVDSASKAYGNRAKHSYCHPVNQHWDACAPLGHLNLVQEILLGQS